MAKKRPTTAEIRAHRARVTARKKAAKLAASLPVAAKAELIEEHKSLKNSRSRRIVLEQGTVEIIEELDASWAELLLANLHPDQRRLRALHLARIERALKSGTWVWTGDPIRIDAELNVIDGQHRLTAVANTGVAIHNAILITIDNPEVMKVLDTTSAPRSLGDIFKIHGEAQINNTVVAAILYESSDFVKRTTRTLSKPERYDLIKGYDLTEEALKLYNAGQRGMRITSGPIAGALRCVRKNPEKALAFFTAAFSNQHFLVVKGEDVPCTQVSVLANWLIHVREQQRSGKGRTSGEEFITEGVIKAIRAWNAYRAGRHITKLQMPRNGLIPTPRN